MHIQVYIYSNLLDNPLKIAILRLFCNLKSRFGNLITGVLTRESVREAFYNGITSDQVIPVN